MAELIGINDEMRKSYLEYSLSVIIGRAIPDARDGLKPVHRRILYAQKVLGNNWNSPTVKCARVVGDVIGKYHPHGDTAVYDALVRLAQDFSMRDPLEQGQGNFGSIDGDKAAAMRYTEVRMSRLASEFLNDIDKNTVDFIPNYDSSLQEPVVLPTRVPNLLLNGSSGIAVGMATNIPPHNLGELCDALIMLVDNPEAGVGDLMKVVHGPDFPTGGAVYAGQGLRDAYMTGRGTVKIRGKVSVEERRKGVQDIVITEIPFGLNKAALVKKIAGLINDRKIDGVSDLRDESRKNIRIVIELKRGTIPEIVINSLYKYTPLETSFGFNMLSVVDNRPVMLNLKTALTIFLEHRREVVVRRTRFELEKAEARAHILQGLLKALDLIDAVVHTIRSSKTPPEAKERLMTEFDFSDVQAQAILDMRLQRLTGLEKEKLEVELAELEKQIEWYKSILGDQKVLWGVIRDEIIQIKETYSTPRLTEVVYDSLEDIVPEDLIPDEDVVITISRRGYIKRASLANYQQQKRGGKGIAGAHTSEDDYIQHFITTTNHQFILLFTNQGRMHQLKVHQVPEGSRTAKGIHIANLVPLLEGESVSAVLTVREFADDRFFLFSTKKGMVKRSRASLYARARKTGLMAVSLREDDELIMVQEVTDSDFVVLATADGLAIRFMCRDIRDMGRIAAGVKGIALRQGDNVVSCLVMPAPENGPVPEILTVSSLGYGKRTPMDRYRLQSRGGKGIINFRVTAKTGPVLGSTYVEAGQALVMISSNNKIIRTSVDEISRVGRATSGVRLVRLDDGGHVIGFDTVNAERLEGVKTEEVHPEGASPHEAAEKDEE